MGIIKVQSSIFSSIKTINKALEKMLVGDEIHIAKGTYEETINITQDCLLLGAHRQDTVLEGVFTIPKGVSVIFKQMTIRPDVQFYIEGMATFIDINFDGQKANSILSIEEGIVSLQYCKVVNAQDIGISLIKQSELEIKESHFDRNKKAHIYAEHSKIRVSTSIFESSNHALWLKNECDVLSGTNTFTHQAGTQVIVQGNSLFKDTGSNIINGRGNGIFCSEQSKLELSNTIIKNHALPQIWIQDQSMITAENSDIQGGHESAIMVRTNSDVSLAHCYISNHPIANIQVTEESRLHITHSSVINSQGIGIHVKERSIVNLEHTHIAHNRLSQLFISKKSIASIKESVIERGQQVGLFLEEDSNCTMVNSKVHHHPNTAITVTDAELILLECEIAHNVGNGILAIQNASIQVDICKFHENQMPHIAAKDQTAIAITTTDFIGGKSIYLIDNSYGHLTDSLFANGDGTQIEVSDGTKLTISKCKIMNGNANGIKANKNSSIHMSECQITNHRMPQIAINDSSFIMKECEVLEGSRNGFIIENHSEALIVDSFISKHQYPQVWVDNHSNLELKYTQLTEGKESDLYAQDFSDVIADACIIRNDQFKYNVQAVNHSKIQLNDSIVENSMGERFFMENNSYITNKEVKE